MKWAWVAALMVGVGVFACGGEDDQVQKSIAIWRSLPEMPGATFLAQGNEPIRDGGDVVGYWTRVNYHVPDDVTVDDVMSFYIGALEGEWSHCESDANDVSVPGITEEGERIDVRAEMFVRERSSVLVSTYGMHANDFGQSYELYIDSVEETDRCTSEVFE